VARYFGDLALQEDEVQYRRRGFAKLDRSYCRSGAPPYYSHLISDGRRKGEGAMEMHAMRLLKFTVWVVFFFLEELEL
jgi:hypothetical protein